MVNDTAATPVMGTLPAVMSYAELQRERDRLRHGLRKAKHAEEKEYENAEGRVVQYIDMVIASVTKAEEQGKAIARLLQEAKDSAEEGEANEKAKIQGLTRELTAMTERAYRTEEALREKTRTSDLEAIRNLAHSCKARVKDNALSRQFKSSEERLKKAKTNLDQARGDLDAVNERTAKFAELTKSSFTLASGVPTNSFAKGERMTTCCNHLGNIMDVVSSASEKFACAVDSSRQGMRLVTYPKAPGLRVQMLMGTSDETEAQMTKDKCTELTPFMHETQSTVARKKVYL
ncbi:hypothetical protein DVH05_014942 [Phytophthora capsici]|nr:hypothetical protein DVH05_014942 [Phytophthora capsici]